MSGAVPTASAQIRTLVRLTLMRLVRGRALWVCFFIALAPIFVGFAFRTRKDGPDIAAAVELIAMTLLSPVFVSASIGEEIEDRTSTYLWSRPLGRWVMIVGKLLALAPVAMFLIVLGWNLAILLGTHSLPPPRSTLAFAAGALGIATMTAGIATLLPKHGMALSIVYIVILDSAIGAIPASVHTISVTRQVRLLSGLSAFGDESAILAPAITIIVLAAVWLAIGVWRVKKLES